MTTAPATMGASARDAAATELSMPYTDPAAAGGVRWASMAEMAGRTPPVARPISTFTAMSCSTSVTYAIGT